MNTEVFDLNLSQTDIYFDQIKLSDNPLYNIGGYIRLKTIDVERIVQAHHDLVASEPLFGLRILTTEQGIKQTIVAERDYGLPLIDLSDENDPFAAADKWVDALFEQPIDIDNKPLYSGYLVKMADDAYRYVAKAHHLMMDGWGFSKWAQKLSFHYNGQTSVDEQQTQNQGLWLQIAEQDKAYLNSAKAQKDSDYWLLDKKMRGGLFLKPHYLCQFDKPTLVPSNRYHQPISVELAAKVTKAAQTLGVGNSQIYQAALSCYLFDAYAREKQVFGMPFHNRKNHQQKGMLGVFTSFSPLALTLESQSSFADVARQLAAEQKRNFRHQRYPIGRIINDYKGVSEQDELYDVSFNFLKLELALDFDEVAVDLIYVSNHHEKEPLKVTVWEYGEQEDTVIHFDYNYGYFNDEQIVALSQKYLDILVKACEAPSSQLSSLAVMSGQEKQAIRDLDAEYEARQKLKAEVIDYNRTLTATEQALKAIWQEQLFGGNKTAQTSIAQNDFDVSEIVNPVAEDVNQQAALLSVNQGAEVEFEAQALMHELFDRKADAQPDEIALIFGDQSIAYGELRDAVNRHSRWLMENGVATGDAVAVYMERSVEMVIALLAIMKAGGAYVPLDPDHPVARAREVIKEAEIKLALTQLHLADVLGSLEDCRVYEINNPEVKSEIDSFSPQGFSRPEGLDSNGLAYVIYTSGSTGKPKGVMLEHRTLINRLEWIAQCHRLQPGDRVLQKTPYGFDVSVWEFFWTLGFGGTLVLAKPGGHKDPLYLTELMAQHDVAVLHFVPSMLNAFLSTADARLADSVKTVFCSGEALNKKDVKTLQTQHKTANIFNLYGPTEASIDVSMFDCRNVDNYQHVPIGQAIQNVNLYVLDEQMRLLPDGVPGQLYIGGESLARGYYKAPELTEKAFIAHHWPNGEVELLYKSGDLVKRLSDGNIDYLGRIDHQVKLRGLRVELGEIESRLQQFEGIDSVVVLVVGSGEAANLVAFVKTNSQTALDEQQAQTFLSETLPAYMVPEQYIELEQWPQNNNGKIDRKQLLAMVKAEQNSKTIGLSDSFFKLGGNSLQSIKLLNQINRQFNAGLSLPDIFAAEKLADMAKLIETKAGSIHSEIAKVDDSQPVVLSHAQQRLWLIDQLNQGSSQYNMPVAFDVSGPFDVKIAEKALNYVISKHPVLSTVYQEFSGQAAQIVRKDVALELSYGQNQSVESFVQSQANESFDLSADLMLRAAWLSKGENQGILALCVHHIAADGWSVKLILDDFIEAYQNLSQGIELNVVAGKQYADYAAFSREHGQNAIDEALGYWQQQLSDAPVKHSLPLDKPRPMQQSFEGEVFETTLTTELTEQIAQLAKQNQVTEFVLMHALFSVLISRHSGQQDILIGTPVANRLHPDVESMVGFFVNTLVLRTEVAGQLSFADYLKQVAQVNRDALNHQMMPFEQLVDELDISRTRAHNPLFQVMLTMDNSELNPFELAGATFTPIEQQEVKAKFDIELILSQTFDNKMVCRWVYDSALFNQSSIERLQQHLNRLAQAVVKDANVNCHKLSMLSADELNHQINTLNAEQLDYPVDATLPELFAEQVKRTPDAIALEFDDYQLSFKSLDEQSLQLAHYLIDKGVKSQDLVGVSLNRTQNMVIAVLAIHKAGGAYVPMDPSYPSERLGQIIEQCDLKFLFVEDEHTERFADNRELKLLSTAERFEYSATAPDMSDLSAEQPAYVIFTSGSTGVPKGVVIRHRNTISMLYWAKQRYRDAELKKVLASTSLNFDLSVFELFVPLCFGHTCVLAENALSLLEGQWDVTLVNTVPSAIKVLIGEGAIPQSASVINLAGEPLPQATVNDLLALEQVNKVFNLYGPSEDTTYSTCAEFTQSLKDAPHIGKVLPNSQAYVLSPEGEVVPFGAVGELYLAGAGVTQGYYQKPEMTAERYLPNPFGQTNEVYYRTGDLVRYRQDGNFDYLGRADEQLKIRGFRVEPGEIASQLTSLAGVEDAQVVSAEDLNGQLCLVAYVVPVKPDNVTDRHFSSGIKAELQQQLPEYMVPAAFVTLEKWPLTANGKINKRALPAPDWLETQEYLAPSTETEQQLVNLIAEQFNRPAAQISISANFFELGLNSLSALSLIKNINKALNISLKPDAVFEHSTIQALCQHLDLCYLMPTLLVEDDDEFETDGEI